MSKSKKKNAKGTALLPPELQKQVDEAIRNGLGGSIGFGTNPFGLPGNQANPFSETIESADTLFRNLRFYLVSNFRQILSQIYVEIGLVQTIVDVPVDDALRGGVEIKSKQLDEEQIQELQISLDRDDDINTVGQACKWNRLFGGAGILVLTDQDPQEPLNLEAIGKDTPLEFRAVDMWELFWDKQNTEGYDPAIQTQEFDFYNYYAEQVHKSRVMRLKGMTAPSFVRPRLRGWGFSVVEVLVRSINQYLKATDLGFEVLDEFKIDVFKVKNLVNTLLSPNGMQKVQERVRMTNWQKNYQHAIVMDGEDDFDHKQLSFSGLAEVMAGIRMQVAADMRMPIIKLFGQSVSSGLGNSAQEEMENYNSMVESQVRNKIKYDLLRVCEIKCQKLFGFVPDDLSLSFKPLRELTAEQEENVKTQKFNRLLAAKTAGELSTLEFRDGCNKGNLFDITLDTSTDRLNPNDPEIEEIVKEDGQDPSQLKDVDDPGANREDTRKTAKETKPVKQLKNTIDWDESSHPRDEDGQFASGGDSSGSHSDKSTKSREEIRIDYKQKETKTKEVNASFKKLFSHEDQLKIISETQGKNFIEQQKFFEKEFPSAVGPFRKLLTAKKNELLAYKDLIERDLEEKSLDKSVLKRVKKELKDDVLPALEKLKELGIGEKKSNGPIKKFLTKLNIRS